MAEVPEEIIEHYAAVEDEAERLNAGPDGNMEAIRTMELLGRFLPPPPARILDVGGGPGFYSRKLTAAGYEVHLVDPVPRHIEAASGESPLGPPPAAARLGDAREIEGPDESYDAVLVMGPMYHLTGRSDRMVALGEARRVLRKGGLLAAAAITRFASALDGLDRGLIDDPGFVEIMRRDLAEGQHRNPSGDPRYFTTAFFHEPEGLRAEMADAGFDEIVVYAVEGVSWAAHDLDQRLADPARREVVLEIVRRTETEPSLLGASPHLLGFGRR